MKWGMTAVLLGLAGATAGEIAGSGGNIHSPTCIIVPIFTEEQ